MRAEPDTVATAYYLGSGTSSARSIALPKYGGAVHAIGKKFVTNSKTGSGSMSVQTATSRFPSGSKHRRSLACCSLRSTDITDSHDRNDERDQLQSYLLAVTETGYRRVAGSGYVSRSMPPVEFEHTESTVVEVAEEVDPEHPRKTARGLGWNGDLYDEVIGIALVLLPFTHSESAQSTFPRDRVVFGNRLAGARNSEATQNDFWQII